MNTDSRSELAAAPLSSKAIQRARRRKRTRLSLRRYLVAWSSVFLGFALWELAGRYIVKNPLFLATPIQAAGALLELVQTGELQHHAWVSAQEFLIGFVVASFFGILIGLLMASFAIVANALQPWVAGIYATPIVAIAPLLILWFGIGIWSKVAVVISLVIFPVTINTEVGIRSTDRQLIEAVRVFGATRWQIFRKVSLPAAIPFILAGLRLGVGRGLIGVVVGELFGARAGIGFLILQSAEVFNMPQLFAGVLVLAISGIVLTAGFQMLERILAPWQ